MKQSDKKLINLVKQIHHKAIENPEFSEHLIQTNLYILEKYIFTIILSKYLSTSFLNEVLTRIAFEDTDPIEILASITEEVKIREFNPEITETVLYIIELFVNTASESKKLIKPHLKYFLRRTIANALNCGIHAKPVNEILGEDKENDNLGEKIAQEIITERKAEKKLGSSENPIFLDEL